MAALTRARLGGAHAGHVADAPDPEVPERPRRRRFTALYKRAVVAEYDRLTEPGARGALLRREGLHSWHLVAWRRALSEGGTPALDRKRGRKPADRRDGEIARLRQRAERAEAQLGKARLVIEVQGEVHVLLEQLSESAEPGQDDSVMQLQHLAVRPGQTATHTLRSKQARSGVRE